ncbi:MAG: nucleotidyl transferase AbiEii/AbiGii toxin family protein [Verrucomicrobiota bacterium]
MSLFENLVRQAMQARPELAAVQAVVEKELLHHDILREMAAGGFLAGLTFMGGTCLRACYGSVRLSEDLDFTGGSSFTRKSLASLARKLPERLEARYGLKVSVSEPVKETRGVDTWKLSVVTQPERKHLPAQRIHIDICAIPSHDPRPMMLRNLYGVDLGTSGLILQAQSRAEILADKIIALAFRLNRLKNRDLWDIGWLKQQGVELPLALIPAKIRDHGHTTTEFRSQLQTRLFSLDADPVVRREFIDEMRRFLPAATVGETVAQATYWQYLTDLLRAEAGRAMQAAVQPLK